MEEVEEKQDVKEEAVDPLNPCDCSRRCFYRDSKVFEVIPSNEEQLKLIEEFREKPNLDFWSDEANITDPINIMVPAVFQSEFQDVLQKNDVEHKIIVEDVEEFIEREKLQQADLPDLTDGTLNLHKYHRYETMQNHFHQLSRQYSNLMRVENYGLSCQRRNLTVVHISRTSVRTKPVIFIDAGIHAREWISPAFALYIIHQLLENSDNKYLIENVDWMIVPLINPDGYEYTHTTDRFWRKTRSKGKTCYGVDGNRNFDFQWMTGGSSSSECSNTYAGPKPFSEPETFNLCKLLMKYAKQIKLYVTVHSAAQCILYPWGFTRELPADAEDLHFLAADVRDAILAVNGTEYRIGNSAGVLVLSSGCSTDWAKGVAGIKWSYVLELPPGGEHRFDLPPSRIQNVVEEAFEGVKVFHEHIETHYTSINIHNKRHYSKS